MDDFKVNEKLGRFTKAKIFFTLARHLLLVLNFLTFKI